MSNNRKPTKNINPNNNNLDKAIKEFEKGNYLEAIEFFLIILGQGENETARRFLAKCYFRLGNYNLAKKHFEILSNFDNEKEYAKSMLATISAIQGNFSEAIKTLKQLPKSTPNLINLSIMYWQKYKVEKAEWLLDEARKILNSIDLTTTPEYLLWNVYINLGIINQALKEYSLAESCYKKALNSTDIPINKAKILNEYGKLYIDIDKLDEAEEILDEALALVDNANSITKGYNFKYRGIIYKRRKDFETAKEWLILASNNFQEQNLYQELLEVCIILVEMHNPKKKFYEIAGNFAESLFYEKKMKELSNNDLRTIDLILKNINEYLKKEKEEEK